MNLVTGTLKGYDQLMNLVLDDVKESMRGKTITSAIIERLSSNNIQMTKATRLLVPLG